MIPKVVQKPRMTSEERRAYIVRTACELFADKGFRGTTTRELAAAAGITEPVLYEHFKTKRDLYSAIIEQKAQASQRSLESLHHKFEHSGDDLGYFCALGEEIVDWYISDPSFVRLLLFSSLEGHELKELMHGRVSNCFQEISSYIERRIRQGAMRQVDPVLAARAFFGMIAHYVLTGLVFEFAPLPGNTKQIVSEMAGIFLAGMYEQDNKQ